MPAQRRTSRAIGADAWKDDDRVTIARSRRRVARHFCATNLKAARQSHSPGKASGGRPVGNALEGKARAGEKATSERAASQGSMHEQRDQDDDGNGDAEEQQQQRTHVGLLKGE